MLRVDVLIPPQIAEPLKLLAKQQGQTVSSLCRHAIAEHVAAKLKANPNILRGVYISKLDSLVAQYKPGKGREIFQKIVELRHEAITAGAADNSKQAAELIPIPQQIVDANYDEEVDERAERSKQAMAATIAASRKHAAPAQSAAPSKTHNPPPRLDLSDLDNLHFDTDD